MNTKLIDAGKEFFAYCDTFPHLKTAQAETGLALAYNTEDGTVTVQALEYGKMPRGARMIQWYWSRYRKTPELGLKVNAPAEFITASRIQGPAGTYLQRVHGEHGAPTIEIFWKPADFEQRLKGVLTDEVAEWLFRDFANIVAACPAASRTLEQSGRAVAEQAEQAEDPA